MGLIHEITRESWILSTFPEWGTWLNEEIEAEQVERDTFALWWLGCMGLWLKTDGGTHLCMDLWCKTGKQSQKEKFMKKQHQHQRMIGCVNLQPNLRNSPCVIDPFAITNLHALLATHDHSDHIDPNVAAAVMKNCAADLPFIGPESCVALWTQWGVPASRCKTVAPGDVVKIRDVEIVVLESFDRTELVTSSSPQPLKDTMPMDMNRKAVNYLIKTSGGNFYHAGDSHYSNYFAKHGNDHSIDVAVAAYGENPRGMTDKLTSVDILRMAESLNTKVVIPLHYDIWTNFQADTREILMLWELKRRRLRYAFTPFIWQVGGKYIYPRDKDVVEFQYRRGFEDAFAIEPDLPFPSML